MAQIWLTGRGRESGIEVKGVEAGHLVRFRNLKIVEYLAFPTWDLALEHLNQLSAGASRTRWARSAPGRSTEYVTERLVPMPCTRRQIPRPRRPPEIGS